jgi:pantothenate synthetase
LSTEKDLVKLREKLKLANIRIDYLEENEGRLFAAVWIGNVRLIDNRLKEKKHDTLS